jgi:hypothetical protein
MNSYSGIMASNLLNVDIKVWISQVHEAMLRNYSKRAASLSWPVPETALCASTQWPSRLSHGLCGVVSWASSSNALAETGLRDRDGKRRRNGAESTGRREHKSTIRCATHGLGPLQKQVQQGLVSIGGQAWRRTRMRFGRQAVGLMRALQPTVYRRTIDAKHASHRLRTRPMSNRPLWPAGVAAPTLRRTVRAPSIC